MSCLVYVAAPLTTGDVLTNIHLAAKAGNRLLRAGFLPIVPHLFSFSEMIDPVAPERGSSWDAWMAWCLKYVKRSDCVLRLPGTSRGADTEVSFAREHGIPVFFTEEELRKSVRPQASTPGDPNCPHTKTYPIGGWVKCAACGAWRD